MSAVDASSPETASSPATQQAIAVRMPIEEPVNDREEALRKLKACSHTELHRARKRHRRALESLGNGGYNSLSDSTRERLRGQLRGNLDLLNQALESDGSESVEEDTSQEQTSDATLLGRLKDSLRRLWST